jgi:hypothetical protein
MFNKKLILLLLAVVGIATSGVITQAISEVKLENQTMLALQGQCGECEGQQSCTWCDSWGTGSEFCSGGAYYDCVDTEEEKSCGTCDEWAKCGDFYDCANPGCTNCQKTGECEGCSHVEGGDPC